MPLTTRMLVGRSPACGLQLTDLHSSGEHATFAWTGTRWEVRDLGSRNGTYVDGDRLEPGATAPLKAGSTVAFGDPENPWELADDGAPRAMAIDLETREVREAEGHLLVLPDDDAPELAIYPNAQGRWQEETSEGELRAIKDQEVVQTSVGTWQVQLPFTDGDPVTDARAQRGSEVSFRFRVPEGEARPEVILVVQDEPTSIEPDESARLLIALARKRKRDAQLDPDKRGWSTVRELSRELEMEPEQLHRWLYSARRTLCRAGVDHPALIVQVERDKRRLGTDRFEFLSP